MINLGISTIFTNIWTQIASYFNNYSENLIESKELNSVSQINVDIKNSDIFVEHSDNNKIIVELTPRFVYY